MIVLVYWGGIFDWDKSLLRLEELNAIIEKDDFWNNNNNAQIIMRERSQIEESMSDCLSLERRLEDFITLIELMFLPSHSSDTGGIWFWG